LLSFFRTGRSCFGARGNVLLEVLFLASLFGLLTGLEALLEGVDGRLEVLLGRKGALGADVVEQLAVATAELLQQLGLEATHVAGGDVVDEPAGTGEDGDDLLLD